MPTAAESLRKKKIDTSARSTAEWDIVQSQIRERSFFMAGIADANILQAFRNAARRVAMGRASITEVRRDLRLTLLQMGYTPEKGKENTIHDLLSRRRMQVTINTNVRLAHGWAARKRQLQDPTHPAQELFRSRQAKKPRDWTARWNAAAEAVNWQGVARNGQMIATLRSPIWTQISRFNLPYPPYDFNSGMSVRPIAIDQARQLGLTDPPTPQDPQPQHTVPQDPQDPQTPQDLQPQAPRAPQDTTPSVEEQTASTRERYASMNEEIQAIMDGFDEDIRQALILSMRGLASLQKQDKKSKPAPRTQTVLTMNDINGTSIKTSQEMARILEEAQWGPCGEELRLALQQWVQDSSAYDLPGNYKESVKFAGFPARARMKALLARLAPYKTGPEEPLYRGLNMSEPSYKKFLDIIKKAGYVYTPLAKKVGESFCSSIENAKRFAAGGGEKYEVIIVCHRQQSARDLRPLYKVINPPKNNPYHPLNLESELIIPPGTRMQIDKSREERFYLPNGHVRIFMHAEEITAHKK